MFYKLYAYKNASLLINVSMPAVCCAKNVILPRILSHEYIIYSIAKTKNFWGADK